MKRFTLFLLGAMLALSINVVNAGTIKVFNKAYTGNVSAVALPSYMTSTYLYEVKVVASVDDAITITFTDVDGNAIWAGTTASATSTEYLDPSDDGAYRVLPAGAKIAISDYAGGGTATITVIGVE